MRIDVHHKGNFEKTYKFLTHVSKKDFRDILHKWGQAGVNALAAATPKDTGETAASWGYEVRKFFNHATITWTNSNIVDGIPVVILIQYGHGVKGGGYVQGKDFINPALLPIFEDIADSVWKEVTSS